MSMVTCAECSREISTAALMCPQCGRPSTAPLRRWLTRPVSRRIAGVVVVAIFALGLHAVQRARALGVPTLTTLAYSGSLTTFGAPDNSTHTMVLALFVAGANDGGIGSAACTTTATVTCVNGQFSVPLSSSCVAIVQANPNVQAEVTVDNTAMGLINVSAVPYAIEAGTAASVAAVNIAGILPIANGGTGLSTGLNYIYQLGTALPTDPCVGNGAWAAVPSLGAVTLTTSGRPVLVMGAVRQYKTGTCAQHGSVAVKLDGNLLLDPNGLGPASSYECNAVATFSSLIVPAAGSHTFQFFEMGDAGGVCTEGTNDFIYVQELPNPPA